MQQTATSCLFGIILLIILSFGIVTFIFEQKNDEIIFLNKQIDALKAEMNRFDLDRNTENEELSRIAIPEDSSFEIDENVVEKDEEEDKSPVFLSLRGTNNNDVEVVRKLQEDDVRDRHFIAPCENNIEFLNDDILRELNAALNQLTDQERLNFELSSSILELTEQNEFLTNSNTEYALLNRQLNASIVELREQNSNLTKQNEIYATLNAQLKSTSTTLGDEVNRLEVALDDLGDENGRLNALVTSLSEEVTTLSALNDKLNSSVLDLDIQVDRLTAENDKLSTLNVELNTIVSFLNETAQDLNESYEDVTDFLASQIQVYRTVVLETLQNTYIQRVANWDCSFKDVFNDQNFTNNANEAIPEPQYTQVMEYIDDRILSNLCLNVNDFQQYMQGRFGGSATTTNHLISGMEGYTTAALDHYFPDEGEEGGLTRESWAAAGYDCENLTESEKYSFANSGGIQDRSIQSGAN